MVSAVSIISKIVIFIALMLMPIGLILAVQGSYFQNLTSKDYVSGLLDSAVNEIYQQQSAEFKPYCQLNNISCNTLDEAANSVCSKTSEMRISADNAAKAACSNAGMTCSNVETARSSFCQAFGQNDTSCSQMNAVVEQVSAAESACTQLRDFQNQIKQQKDSAYNQDMGGFSLAGINALLANAMLAGIVIVVLSIVMVYIASRKISTVLNSIAFTVLATGICVLLLGYFGYSLVTSALPAEIAGNLPKALDSFLKGVFDFEFSSGIYMTVAGIALFIAVFVLKKFYFTEEPEKKKK